MSAASHTDVAPAAPFRCAVAARARHDPIVGTAPPVRRWLLLEHPGPWRVDAVAGLPLSPTVRSALHHAAQHAQARILLIRRPGRPHLATPRHWRIADEDGATVGGPWRDEEDLLVAAAALEAPVLPAGDPEPLLLVCTHGIHDVCCAIRGRPVAAALARRWPRQVWECSHVGGDRFAPNVVVLPAGFYYGNLDEDSAVSTIERHVSGRVATEHLRGISRFAAPAQVAVIEAYRRYGPLPPGAVHAASTIARAGFTVVDVTVAGLPGGLRAVVRAEQRPPAQLTCRAPRETAATEYDLVSLDPIG